MVVGLTTRPERGYADSSMLGLFRVSFSGFMIMVAGSHEHCYDSYDFAFTFSLSLSVLDTIIAAAICLLRDTRLELLVRLDMCIDTVLYFVTVGLPVDRERPLC